MSTEIVAAIIRKFGTQERLAELLAVRQSVIAGWKRRGVVPARQQMRVLQVARDQGIDLTPHDFFESASEAA